MKMDSIVFMGVQFGIIPVIQYDRDKGIALFQLRRSGKIHEGIP